MVSFYMCIIRFVSLVHNSHTFTAERTSCLHWIHVIECLPVSSSNFVLSECSYHSWQKSIFIFQVLLPTQCWDSNGRLHPALLAVSPASPPNVEQKRYKHKLYLIYLTVSNVFNRNLSNSFCIETTTTTTTTTIIIIITTTTTTTHLYAQNLMLADWTHWTRIECMPEDNTDL